MNFYITSDQHFFHQNIIKYCHRPFTNDYNGVVENIDTIIKNYNSVVQGDDMVIHLGDLGFGKQQSKINIGCLLETLNGRKVLIKGNHDNWGNDYYLKHFESVNDYLILGDTFLCHYPCYIVEDNIYRLDQEIKLHNILQKSGCKKIIHGHIHNIDSSTWDLDGCTRTNVSVDFLGIDYTPVKITDSKLIKLLEDMYK